MPLVQMEAATCRKDLPPSTGVADATAMRARVGMTGPVARSTDMFKRRLTGRRCHMIGAIIGAIVMILGLILDIITLPVRIVIALLGGAEFEFRKFGKRRRR